MGLTRRHEVLEVYAPGWMLDGEAREDEAMPDSGMNFAYCRLLSFDEVGPPGRFTRKRRRSHLESSTAP